MTTTPEELQRMKTKARLAHLPMHAKKHFVGKSQEEITDQVQKNNAEIPAALRAEIQKFVIEQQKKGVSTRKVKKMVKEKFKVTII